MPADSAPPPASGALREPPRLGLRSGASVLRWLVVDTFRQSLASSIFWVMLLISLAAIIFCFGIGMEGGAPQLRDGRPFNPADMVGRQAPGLERVHGQVSYFFGAIKADLHRDRESTVKLIHVVLGQWVAGVAGLILAIIFTAGFLPAFLEPSSATVLLAKPVPRWLLLLGKVLGVTVFLGLLCGLFIVGTWWALALKTGIWSRGYLWCWPLLVFHFVLVYSFSTLLAVMTRNTTVCVFGTIVFWLVCYGVNYGRHAHVAFDALTGPGITLPRSDGTPPPAVAQKSAAAGALVEAGYWLLPKPMDLVVLLEESMHAHENFATVARQEVMLDVKRQGRFHPLWSLLSSLAGAAMFLAMAAWEFHKMDY